MKLQSESLRVLREKYMVGDEKEPKDVLRRVAKALAAVEMGNKRAAFESEFLWALENGAYPGGRIMANAGAQHLKPGASLINCTVSQVIGDSMESILESVKRAGLTLKAGCGIGYDFTTLRPKGAQVAGAGASTSGPIPFADIYNATCKTVSAAGARRGAQMGCMEVCHPDIREFIAAKREKGRLDQFNLSVLVTDAFMHAVKNDTDWALYFPGRNPDTEDGMWASSWPSCEDWHVVREDGMVWVRVYEWVKARDLWNLIMRSAYRYSDPGVLFIDRINDGNHLRGYETIRATNPCGEQPLPPNGSCLLGSIDLTECVVRPFMLPIAKFDFRKLVRLVQTFTRMLDNVVEIANLPLSEQRDELRHKRRHGMGVMGLGSAFVMLGLRYGSRESVELTDRIMRTIAEAGWQVGQELAREKGMAPAIAAAMVEGEKQLWNAPVFNRMSDTQDALRRNGCRFTHHMSTAPTGTLALTFGNNCSNGIEPSFAHRYYRNLTVEGRKTKEQIEVVSKELLLYRELVNPKADPDAKDGPNKLPDYFVKADDLTVDEHLAVMAAAQQWVDASISKTINLPTEISFEDFKGVYKQAYAMGLKGCTTFRFEPEVHQGVLVTQDQLKNTRYRFTLADGSTVEATGDQTITYEGIEHSAANLHDVYGVRNGQ